MSFNHIARLARDGDVVADCAQAHRIFDLVRCPIHDNVIVVHRTLLDPGIYLVDLAQHGDRNHLARFSLEMAHVSTRAP